MASKDKKYRKRRKKKKRKKRIRKERNYRSSLSFEDSSFYDLLVLLKFLINILYFPVLLILFVFRLIDFKKLMSPIYVIKDYIKGSKHTFFLVFLILITSILGILIYNFNQPFYQNHLVNSQENFANQRFHTLFTSIFIHGSIYHLISNIIALIFFGKIVERHLKRKYLLIFFASGIFSNLLRLFLTSTEVGSIGASGAISALIPIAVLCNPIKITFISPLPLTTMAFAVMWLLNEFAALNIPNNIANDVHIFGFSIGFLLGFIFIRDAFRRLLIGIFLNVILGVIFYYLWYVFL
ncbi:MAG: rhomboid family intramembrane serine protease [Candidatus Woesearchaeota archaeon]